jgi:hypothetical protein
LKVVCILNDLARFQLMNEFLLLIRLERIVKIRLIVDLGPCNQANLEPMGVTTSI